VSASTPAPTTPRRAGAAVAAAALAVGAVLAAFLLDPAIAPRARDGAGPGSGAPGAPGAPGDASGPGGESPAMAPVATPASPGAVADAALLGAVRGPADAPVAGARVRAARIRARPPDEREAVADEAGAYALDGLAPGLWLVEAGGGRFRDRATRASLSSGERARLDFTLEPGGTVRGRVVDTRGAPLAGIEVVSAPRPRRTVATGADGAFEIGGCETEDPHLLLEARDPAGRHAPESRLAEVDGPALEIALAAAGRFVGRVTEFATGAPVEGAAATLDERPVPERLPLHIEARSGAEGTVEVAGLRPGAYRVHVEKEGHAPGESQFTVAEGETVESEIVLGGGGAIVGRVTSAADGAPLEGATVWDATGEDLAGALAAPESLATVPGVRSARTAADGSFRLEGAPPGRRDLVVSHPERLGRARAVEVPPAGEARLDVALEDGGAIVGTVRGPGGTPVAGAVVAATPEHGPARRTMTDEAGAYALRGLPPGKYVVSVRMPSDAADGDATGAMRTVRVESAETVRADFAGAAAVVGDIRGAPPGLRLEAVLVPAVPGAASVRTARVDDDGVFRFDGVDPGAYDLIVEPWVRRRLSIPEGELEVALDLAFPAGSVSGRVLDATGAPVPGAHLSALRAGDRGDPLYAWYSIAARAEADGAFVVVGLEPDIDYELCVRLAGLATEVRTVRSGMTAIDIRLGRGGAIRARAFDPDGAATDVFTLHAEDAFGRRFAGADRGIEDLPPGSYSVTALSPRFGLTRRTAVQVAAGVETTLDLRFSPGASLEVQGLDPTGVPVAGARVDLRFDDGTRVPSTVYLPLAGARTDAAGRLRRDGLSAGRYRGTLRTDDGRAADFDVTIRDGETTRATVVVPGAR